MEHADSSRGLTQAFPDRFYLIVFGSFALAFALFLIPASREFPPGPLYKHTEQHSDAPLIELPTGQTFAAEFTAPGANINGVLARYLFPDEKGDFQLRIENLTRQSVLLDTRLGYGFKRFISFAPGNAKGDRIRVTYHIHASSKDRFPKMQQGITRAHRRPYDPMQIFIDGRQVASEEVIDQRLWPLFQLRYRVSYSWLRFAWPLPFLLLISAWRAPGDARATAAFLLGLGAIAGVTSLLAWFQRYGYQWTYADPDAYGEYAEKLHQWLFAESPVAREEARGWIRDYEHAQVPLTPGILALARTLGVPMFSAYVLWTACCSFLTALLLHWVTMRRLALGARTALLAVLLLTTHVIFLKAFAKPSTDPSGVLLPFASLILVARRFRHPLGRAAEWASAALFLALMTCRPAGLGYAAVFFTANWLADLYRERSWTWRYQVVRPLIYAGLPLLIMGSAFVFFDWRHNFQLNLEKAEMYSKGATWAYFWRSAVVTFYLAIPFAIALRWRDGKTWEVAAAAAWIGVYLVLLLLAKAPLYNRLFLPMLPALLVILAPAISRMLERRRILTFTSVAIWAAVGIVLMLWQIQIPAQLPPRAFDFIHF